MQPTFRLIKLVALAFALGAVVIGGSVAQKVQPQSNWEYLHDAGQRFLDYAKDFNSFAESHEGDNEYDTAAKLGDIASQNVDQLSAIAELVDIYDDAYCEKDRSLVKRHVKLGLADYLRMLDLHIDYANKLVSRTKLPAVSQTGLRMKDDLRNLKAKLSAMQASFE
jgi:hypothetical protein